MSVWSVWAGSTGSTGSGSSCCVGCRVEGLHRDAALLWFLLEFLFMTKSCKRCCSPPQQRSVKTSSHRSCRHGHERLSSRAPFCEASNVQQDGWVWAASRSWRILASGATRWAGLSGSSQPAEDRHATSCPFSSLGSRENWRRCKWLLLR